VIFAFEIESRISTSIESHVSTSTKNRVQLNWSSRMHLINVAIASMRVAFSHIQGVYPYFYN